MDSLRGYSDFFGDLREHCACRAKVCLEVGAYSREEESKRKRYGEDSPKDTAPARLLWEEGREACGQERQVAELADQES